MTNCNDFRTFKKEKGKMCDSLGFHTELCPFKINDVEWNCYDCDENCLVKIDFAIETVQEWSDEHQTKTKQTEFLKLFPNSRMRHCDKDYLVLDVCPVALDSRFSCEEDITCADCQHNYWLEGVE